MVKNVAYVWGGRGGKDMAPLYNDSKIHAFDIAKSEWSALELKEASEEYEPEDRSYHVFTSTKVRGIYQLGLFFRSFPSLRFP